MQLRLFQTLTDISSENSSTVILPVPMDLFRPYLEATNGSDRSYRPPQVERQEESEAERRY